jgi:hypothetical protein
LDLFGAIFKEPHNGAATWRRITAAVGELANNTPPGPVH